MKGLTFTKEQLRQANPVTNLQHSMGIARRHYMPTEYDERELFAKALLSYSSRNSNG